MEKKFKVLGIGNAMVDILIHVTNDFLSEYGIQKGVMQLIDIKRANFLYSDFGSQKEVSGGSGANTVAGLASLGVPTCYIGKVRNDPLGNKFRSDLLCMEINFETKFYKKSRLAETGRCIVFVTPDGERSLNTYLGVTEFLTENDIEPTKVELSDWLYLEGYRFDGLESETAFTKAINIAKKNNNRIALTLSDPFCVERNFSAFKRLIANGLDLLFCNEFELKLLYKTDKLEEAVRKAAVDLPLLACTLGEKGVLVCKSGQILEIPAKQTKPVDTTGAGDLFASGFFYGLINNQPLADCGAMGNLAAYEVIGHLGARPEVDLRSLFSREGFII